MMGLKHILYIYIWLVVLPILKNMSQWEGLSHILWNAEYNGHHDMMEGWNTCRRYFLNIQSHDIW